MDKDTLSDTSKISESSISDPKSREIRTLKKQLANIVKENKILQSEVKNKTDTINNLITQNFTEMRSVQESHTDSIKKINTAYDATIVELANTYDVYKKTLKKQIASTLHIHYDAVQDTLTAVTAENTLLKSINEQLSTELSKLRDELNLINTRFAELSVVDTDRNIRLEQLQTELNTLTELYANTKKDKHDLQTEREKLNNNIVDLQNNLTKLTQQHADLTINHQTILNNYNDVFSRHSVLVTDSITKQTKIDDQNIELIQRDNRIYSLQNQLKSLDDEKNKLQTELAEKISRINILESKILNLTTTLDRLQTDLTKSNLDRETFKNETDILLKRLNTIDSTNLEKITAVQDLHNSELETIRSESKFELDTLTSKYENILKTLETDHKVILNEKEKQLELLKVQVKTFTETQYLAINETEKLKLANDRLRSEQLNIEQRIQEIHNQYRLDIENLNRQFKREKEQIIDTHTDSQKKNQEIIDSLQTRIMQINEALNIAKLTIEDLRNKNDRLENKMEDIQTEEANIQEKYSDLRQENINLKDKLELFTRANEEHIAKEKQYELQIKTLQLKYSKLVEVTKKNLAVGKMNTNIE